LMARVALSVLTRKDTAVISSFAPLKSAWRPIGLWVCGQRKNVVHNSHRPNRNRKSGQMMCYKPRTSSRATDRGLRQRRAVLAGMQRSWSRSPDLILATSAVNIEMSQEQSPHHSDRLCWCSISRLKSRTGLDIPGDRVRPRRRGIEQDCGVCLWHYPESPGRRPLWQLSRQIRIRSQDAFASQLVGLSRCGSKTVLPCFP
jgi:hypothetical protein